MRSFQLGNSKVGTALRSEFEKKSQGKSWGKFEFSEGGKTKKVLKSYCCNAMNYTFLI